ncbi:MAG: hypothetical protein JO307_29290 [Bryobacterales bacterium]|nr:hypothetical protein [Bryobacterales bacterium]
MPSSAASTEIDPDQPVMRVQTAQKLLEEEGFAGPRFIVFVFGVFGAFGGPRSDGCA